MNLNRVFCMLVVASGVMVSAGLAIGQGDEPSDAGTQDSIAADDSAGLAAETEAAKLLALPVVDYKRCILQIISNQTPVIDKQAEMVTTCAEQRAILIGVLPPEFRDLMLLNMDRRLAVVLTAMKDAEGVIDDTAEDIVEIVGELSEDAD